MKRFRRKFFSNLSGGNLTFYEDCQNLIRQLFEKWEKVVENDG